MQIPAFDPNMLVIAILVAGALYGLVAGKNRLRVLILSVYVGIVLAEQLASLVAPSLGMLHGDQITLLLLGLPILLFGFARQRAGHGKHDKGAAIANMIVGILTSALIVASALKLLPVSEVTSIKDDSFIAMMLIQYQLWLLGLLPVVALVLGFMKAPSHKKH